MPICRNSHTTVGSVSRSQCEMPQTSKIKIERQVRFVSEQESRRRDATRDVLLADGHVWIVGMCPTPLRSGSRAEYSSRNLSLKDSTGHFSQAQHIESSCQHGGMALLSNCSSAHVVPQFAKWPHNEASNRVSIDHADRCDVGPGRSLDADLRNCRSGDGSSM
jgi:hypothetical protein